MKSEKFGDLSDEELEAKEGELHEQIFRLRIQKATGQLDQVGKVRTTRKNLARVKTVRSERKKAAAKAEAGRSA
jgi:large subunit ribosomal protein L29